MKVLLTSITIVACIFIFSCSKGTSGPNAGSGPQSLFPLTQGSVWYYQDSAFTDSTVVAAYPDTMTVTKVTYSDNNGTYLGVNNPNGWFNGSYIQVDPNNTAIYEVDSPYFQDYVMYAVPQQDGQIIGQGSSASNNPACPFQTVQYGYLTPVTINGFQCQYNVEYTTDCNSIPQEQIITYIKPGTGVVRIEHYFPDSAQGGPLHKDYTQTLTSATIK